MKQVTPQRAADLGERLKVARIAAGRTQEEVAERIGVTRTTVVAMESGSRAVRDAELVAWASFLGVGVNELVHRQLTVDFGPQFRRATKKGAAVGSDPMVAEVSSLLQRLASNYVQLEEQLGRPLRYDYPPEVRIHRGSVVEQADDLAVDLRSRLGLGLRPIPDLISTAENELTIRVFERRLPSPIAGAFAFSERVGACVLLNLRHPRARRVWTLAHELGHFMSSRSTAEILFADPARSELEPFADAFAASLLLPAGAVRRRFDDAVERDGKLSARSLVYLARSFHVSLEAMARRLEKLTLLKRGTYEALRDRGLSAEKMTSVLGAEDPGHEIALPAPERFNMLVAEAFEKELLSEGQAAATLALDRVAVRELLDVLGGEDGLAVGHG